MRELPKSLLNELAAAGLVALDNEGEFVAWTDTLLELVFESGALCWPLKRTMVSRELGTHCWKAPEMQGQQRTRTCLRCGTTQRHIPGEWVNTEE